MINLPKSFQAINTQYKNLKVMQIYQKMNLRNYSNCLIVNQIVTLYTEIMNYAMIIIKKDFVNKAKIAFSFIIHREIRRERDINCYGYQNGFLKQFSKTLIGILLFYNNDMYLPNQTRYFLYFNQERLSISLKSFLNNAKFKMLLVVNFLIRINLYTINLMIKDILFCLETNQDCIQNQFWIISSFLSTINSKKLFIQMNMRIYGAISAYYQCLINYNQYFYYQMNAHIQPKKQSNFLERFKGKTNVITKESIKALLSKQLDSKVDSNESHSKKKRDENIQDPEKHTNLRYQIQKLRQINWSPADLVSKQANNKELQLGYAISDTNRKKYKANSHRGSLQTDGASVKLPKIAKAQSKYQLPRITQITKSASQQYSNKRASSETDFKKIISLDKNARIQLQFLNLIEEKFKELKQKSEKNEKLFQSGRNKK